MAPTRVTSKGTPSLTKGSLNLVLTYATTDLTVTDTPFGVVLKLKDAQVVGEPGAPAFPSQRMRVALPANSLVKDLSVNLSRRSALTKGPRLVAPIQEPQPAAEPRKRGAKAFKPSLYRKVNAAERIPAPVRRDSAVTLPRIEEYRRVLAAPPPVVRIIDTEHRGVATVVTLEIHPVRQNSKGILELATEIKVVLAYEPVPEEKEATTRTYFRKPRNRAEAARFTNLLRADVINPDWVPEFIPFWPALDVEYLVITDNQAWNAANSTPIAGSAATVGDMVGAFGRLVNWKKRRGLSTRIVTVTDIVNGAYGDFKTGTRDLQEVIRGFLKWAYDEWGVAWVLLGGDDSVVPVRRIAGNACGDISVGAANPPGNNQSFWTGTFLKMHVVGEPGLWWPGNPAAETLVNPTTGAIIPFDAAGTSNAANPGWYFTTDDTYATRSVAPTQFLRVNGTAALLNTNLRWLYTWNTIPTDLYYASLIGASYGLPGVHDWDLVNNGLYGQHTGAANLDGVKMGADVGVGRAPVATAAEAEAFVNKVLAYETLRSPQDATPLDLNWTRRLTVVSTNFARAVQATKTAANPPTEGRYYHGAGQPRSLIRLKEVFTNLEWRLFAKVTDTDLRILPYDPEAAVSGRGWYFSISEADLNPSEVIYTLFGFVFRIPVPTLWVVAYGESDELEPAAYVFDRTTADGSMTDQEILRKQIAADFPAVDVVKRLYEDEIDLPAADAAAPPLAHVTSDRVRDALNLGPHFLCLSGHGNSDGCCHVGGAMAQTASNGYLQPVTYAMSCLTGDFTANDATAEKLLQNPGGGAVAYVGYTRFGWIGSGDDFARLFFTRLKTTRHLALLNDSRFSHTDKWTIFAQNLLGDPEMPVWVGMPKTMKVTHPATIYKQSQEVVVTVKEVSNAPLAGAVVCLSMGDNWVRTAVTNAAGQVHMQITPPSTGTMEVTVTALDHAPYYGSMAVKQKIACGPKVTCSGKILCTPSLTCPPSVICNTAVACKATILCKGTILCKADLLACGVAIECGPALAGCKAGIGNGCPVINPGDLGDIGDIIRESKVRDIRELAQKMGTAPVKAVLDKLSPANRKALQLMLKRIARA